MCVRSRSTYTLGVNGYGVAETKGKKASSAKKHRARKAKAPLQQGNIIEARGTGILYVADGPTAFDRRTLCWELFGSEDPCLIAGLGPCLGLGRGDEGDESDDDDASWKRFLQMQA